MYVSTSGFFSVGCFQQINARNRPAYNSKKSDEKDGQHRSDNKYQKGFSHSHDVSTALSPSMSALAESEQVRGACAGGLNCWMCFC